MDRTVNDRNRGGSCGESRGAETGKCRPDYDLPIFRLKRLRLPKAVPSGRQPCTSSEVATSFQRSALSRSALAFAMKTR